MSNDKFVIDVKTAKADAYATKKYNVKKGDHISKYNDYLEVRESFEAGFDEALKTVKNFPNIFNIKSYDE